MLHGVSVSSLRRQTNNDRDPHGISLRRAVEERKERQIVFVTGNPGVTERDPYPTRTKPQPVIRVGVSAGRGRGSGGFFFMLRVRGYQY